MRERGELSADADAHLPSHAVNATFAAAPPAQPVGWRVLPPQLRTPPLSRDTSFLPRPRHEPLLLAARQRASCPRGPGTSRFATRNRAVSRAFRVWSWRCVKRPVV